MERSIHSRQLALFLAALARHGQEAAAAAEAGLEPSAPQALRDASPAFRAACQRAQDHAVDLLEAEARRRALDGSDTLLLALLKAHRPEKFKDRVAQEHSGPGGGPIPVAAVDRPPPETREDWIVRRQRELESEAGARLLGPAAGTTG